MLYGGAISSSQYEGGFQDKGLDSQDCRPYLVRKDNATVSTRLLTQDVIDRAKDNEGYYPFRKGVEGYYHIDEDIELLKELGIDIYRFSISWSRLYPKGDELEPNQKGIEYYTKVFKKLKEANIKVFLTLNHYAIPLYLIEHYNGWQNRQMITFYQRLVTTIFTNWSEYIDYYVPFNEINAAYFSPYNGIGLIKDQEYDLNKIFQGLHHQFIASALTIKLAKEYKIKAKAGCMVAGFCYYGLTSDPIDQLKALQDEQLHQWFYLDVLAKGYYPNYIKRFFKDNNINIEIKDEDLTLLKDNTCDFISFSYYASNVATNKEAKQTAGNLVVTTKNPYLKASQWGWQIDPVGLRIMLHKIYDRYNLPIFIAENGLGAKDELIDGKVHDEYRIEYLKAHFKEIDECLKDGIDLLGYFLWGVIDIVSAGSCEMTKRYGVIYVDSDNLGNGTYNRYKKDSFYWYQEYIKSKRLQQ